jgi:CRISPR-associated protein Cas1
VEIVTMVDNLVRPDQNSSGDQIALDLLHQYAYCPRRMHLMHVDGRMAHNAFTEEGTWTHRRVDAADEPLPAAGGDDPPPVIRSVSLGSERLGLTAKLDLCELSAGDPIPPDEGNGLFPPDPPANAPKAVPVETKRGSVPDNPERSWEPERVQLMAQGLLLREHGWACDHGVLYFAKSRTRVVVPFTTDLEARTYGLLDQARMAARATRMPPPLIDSPKCHGCSLNGICLPDETHALMAVPADPAAPQVRRLYPARDEAQPLYVQEAGAYVGKKGEGIYVRSRSGEQLAEVRLIDLSQLVLCGGVSISAQALHLLCEAGVAITHLSQGHWFYGITAGFTLKNAYDRAAQFQAASDPARCLAFARAVVEAKCQNQRTLLRRNAEPAPSEALLGLQHAIDAAGRANDLGQLLGIEGGGAAHYFGAFASMLRPKDGPAPDFDLAGRNRRPPKDPVNAMLSFAYAILAKECTVACAGVGLDPFWGFYHQPRHGRPALALDLMEEFRPLVADSAVINAINTGMVAPGMFITGAGACQLTPDGRKALIRAIEMRLDQLATHPIFDYRCSWRAIIRLQAQLLARWLRGDIPAYQGITTR